MNRLNLKVQIEIDGRFVQAGRITGNSFKDAVFSYDESYVSSLGTMLMYGKEASNRKQ